MKYTTATLALAAGATAHTLMSEIYIDGQGQGDGTCIRAPKNAKGAVDPIIDLGSSDMACGQDGTKGVARTCPMTGDQLLTFEYRQWPDDPSRQSLAMGHMGPCSVYLKKVEDATTDSATGDGWFKLWDEGLIDQGSGKWCTQERIAQGGKLSVTIPGSLAGGDYLVRPELLALHNIPEKNQPEYYIGCAQIFLESDGTSGPSETVSIPGHVSKSDPGNQYNPFEKPLKEYTIPGPDVYTPTNSMSAMSSKKQTKGLKKEGTILTQANWCAVELPSFNDEDGCWKADKDCWAQLDTCYDECGATGYQGCKDWEKYCKSNQQSCKSGASGPSNGGKSLETQSSPIEVPAAANGGMKYGSGSGSSNSGKKDTQSSAAPSSSAAAPSPDSYKKKEVKQDNNNYGSDNKEESAPQQTSVADYKPARSSAKAQATTMVTKAKDNQNDPNVVYETVYQTVNEYTTVVDQAYVTETAAPAHYRRHAHARHAHN